jgi:[acyl-carrier-protein] S-malonyltransferase
MRVAYLFPGQGAQRVGMGAALAAAEPRARALFDRASDVLGFDLLSLCEEGPDEALQRTENTQPAILVTSLACLESVRDRLPPPDAAAGLSLGEYSALVAAGALSFEDAVRVVRQRGLYMAETVGERAVAMAAVLGLPAERVETICADAAGPGVCETANYNAADQTVIGGDADAVARAVEAAKAAGAKRVVPLAVSAPFHTSLMRPAAEKLAAVLGDIAVQDARFPVISNVTAAPVREAKEIRALLVQQVRRPVRWAQSMARLVDGGLDLAVELGPGTTLTGMMKRASKTVTTANVEDPPSAERAAAAAAAWKERPDAARTSPARERGSE